MTKNTHRANPWHEGLITAIAVGGFLIILGVVFGLTPGIPGAIGDFFGDLTGVSYPAINGSIVLPGPAHPAEHLAFFGAVFNFMVGIAVLQIVILAMRLYVRSPISKTAEAIGNLVFWAAGAVMANIFLLTGTLNGWFTFWPTLIIFAGVSLITQSLIRFIKRKQ